MRLSMERSIPPCLDEPESCEKRPTCTNREVWDEISTTVWTKVQEVSLADLQDCNCPNSEDKREISLISVLKKSLLDRPFKNSKCKEQKKFKVDAYLDIRESLNFLNRRSNWKIFNGQL